MSEINTQVRKTIQKHLIDTSEPQSRLAKKAEVPWATFVDFLSGGTTSVENLDRLLKAVGKKLTIGKK